MDTTLLMERNLHPKVVGSATLANYELRIGDRASLIPQVGATSYGLVIALSEMEITDLYSEASVSDYVPETVTVFLENVKRPQTATCYNLPAADLGPKCNLKYVRNLSALAKKLGFPKDYVEHIETFGHDT
jgi:hypothetical protein